MTVAFGVIACATLGSLASCSSDVPTDFRKVDVKTMSHDAWEGLLQKYLDSSGRVEYAAWKANADDLKALDDYLNMIANASPDSHPQLFPTPRDAMAYWINTYNALVIRAVLEFWPIESVNDVKSGINFVRGQGFFSNRKYLVGGKRISLYDLENKKLRTLNDPRIHFAINCASRSCPPIDRVAFRAADLDRRLDGRARAFINSDSNVRPDDGEKIVFVSRIFDWYEDDFVAALPKGSTIIDYLLLYAGPPLAERLRRAKAEGWKVRPLEYDWGVNKK